MKIKILLLTRSWTKKMMVVGISENENMMEKLYLSATKSLNEVYFTYSNVFYI